MAAYRTSKEHLSRDEIKNILTQNLKLYKDDPNFLDYFINLTLYLIRFKYKEGETKTQIVTYQPLSQTKQKFFTSGQLGDTQSESRRLCQFCGNVLGDERKCASCGNVNL